jgi:hypothetical protein
MYMVYTYAGQFALRRVYNNSVCARMYSIPVSELIHELMNYDTRAYDMRICRAL